MAVETEPLQKLQKLFTSSYSILKDIFSTTGTTHIIMALQVVSTHLYPLENAIEHHTDRFELLQDGSTAIFRRGQSFYFGMRFNRPFDKVKDVVRTVFVTGKYQ